jgi:D-lactate dehydrogenase
MTKELRKKLKVAIFATKGYDRQSFEKINREFGHELTFFEPKLTPETAPLAAGFEAVCVFVNDRVNHDTITQLADGGTRIIATRSAGYNQIDLDSAETMGLAVVRVPAYSPSAVSEFTVGLILTLGRQIHRAYNRVRDNNFELDGLQGIERNFPKIRGNWDQTESGCPRARMMSARAGNSLVCDTRSQTY